ncbi:NF-kappa-B inhibitor-interacting Ras-like protein [Strongyloides ratti]|uniref:NF-kappa-B inhibitor-interacting Ras-like protein n=1 Tax=Strongyloides ratti TaxID=34506 RepID=A0A090LC08_STRRB|nr:NF-kappa-B inhibitor-interacting Ras-like protein [Strongyloides ratti]CEF67287.1 NF-kappa-B inhibitor-interacting Ras-like protein [Strongyloides ratti]
MAKSYDRQESIISPLPSDCHSDKSPLKESLVDLPLEQERASNLRKLSKVGFKASIVGKLFFTKNSKPLQNSQEVIQEQEDKSVDNNIILPTTSLQHPSLDRRKVSIFSVEPNSSEGKFLENYKKNKRFSIATAIDLPLDSKVLKTIEDETLFTSEEDSEDEGIEKEVLSRVPKNIGNTSPLHGSVKKTILRRNTIFAFDNLRRGSNDNSTVIEEEEEGENIQENSGRKYSGILRRRSTYDKVTMRKTIRIVILGAKRCGKTSFIQQLVYGISPKNDEYTETIEDIYHLQIESPERGREWYILYDTTGIADAIILMYSVKDYESFNKMDILKKNIDKYLGKERQNVPIIVVGTMCDLSGRKVDTEFSATWANKERVKLFEVSNLDRKQLLEIIQHIGSINNHSHKESKFSFSKKLKPEKSSAAILMDI